jgi:hypothetical protein
MKLGIILITTSKVNTVINDVNEVQNNYSDLLHNYFITMLLYNKGWLTNENSIVIQNTQQVNSFFPTQNCFVKYSQEMEVELGKTSVMWHCCINPFHSLT